MQPDEFILYARDTFAERGGAFMSLIIEGVTKRFGDKTVLDNINAVFDEAGITCVMGESGVGKTTLMRILMGLEKPDEGRVAGIGSVSAVFQEDRLIEDISAVENVMLVLGRGVRELAESELEFLLDASSLYQAVSELSGGMRRRVCLVRAMLKESDTLILDEPFTGMDEATKARVIEYIKTRRHDRTCVVVTHQREDAAALGARICLLTRAEAVATI